jgi:XapX domain-containing protein
MITAAIGLIVGLIIGAGCRFFDIPSPAPPRLIGALLLVAMTLGFIAAGQLLPAAQTISQKSAVVQVVKQ